MQLRWLINGGSQSGDTRVNFILISDFENLQLRNHCQLFTHPFVNIYFFKGVQILPYLLDDLNWFALQSFHKLPKATPKCHCEIHLINTLKRACDFIKSKLINIVRFMRIFVFIFRLAFLTAFVFKREESETCPFAKRCALCVNY